MQIIVVSDNHQDKDVLKKVLDDNPNVSLYLHLGDSEMFDYELSPFITVKGNNDYYIDIDHRIVDLGMYKAYMCHGHKMYLNEENMLNKALANNCKFFLFGHIHRPFIKEINGIYLLCPGSLNYPRSQEGCTYMKIHIDEKGNVSIDIINI